jgi:hypothetical protein
MPGSAATRTSRYFGGTLVSGQSVADAASFFIERPNILQGKSY